MPIFTIDQSTPVTAPDQIGRALTDPGFGRYFADHMAKSVWTPDAGWHDSTIGPLTHLDMHPSAAVLHYGQEIFEGLKAYRRLDESVWLFRPDRNAVRFAKSAERLCMPPVPEEMFLEAVTTLVKLDKAWVPQGRGEQSLYIRPFEIASENVLGVREAHEYTFMVIASPVGPYYPDPVWLWVTPTYTRSASGGTGQAKCGGNYAASLIAEEEARQHDCQQVLWLDGSQHRFVEECGTMNILFVTRSGELVTPPLGTILDGVTRNSLLHLADAHGLTPVEQQIDIDDLIVRIREGEVVEALACGTAAVVVPVVGLRAPGTGKGAAEDVVVPVGDATPGPKTRELREHLLAIQYGTMPDPLGWTRRVA